MSRLARAAGKIGPVAVALAALITYAPAIDGPQIFDDKVAIEHNATITRMWPLSAPLHPPDASPVTGRPVVNLSLALNYGFNAALGIDQRPDPDGVHKTVSYHVLNILIHLLCGFLLLGITRRTLRSGRFGDRWVARADAAALLVAGIWLLHPLQSDAVDYLTQRTELIVALCYLGTLYSSIRAWDAPGAASRTRWFAAGVVACLLGMGSKEVMVSAPLMIVLYDRAFRFKSWREIGAAEHRGRRWFYAALAATWLVLVALMAQSPRGESVGFGAGIPWYEYLHTQGWAIAHYLRLVAWPAGFSLDYGSTPIPHWRGIPGLLLLGGLGVATMLAWIRANRWGWLAFLGSWFFLILAPSSSFVPIVTEIAAERRMYLPLAAAVVLLVVAGDRLLDRLTTQRDGIGLRAAATVLLALLAVLTFQRSRVYGEPEVIWREATVRVPGNARAWYNLGVVLDNLPVPRGEEADSLYREAVRLAPSYADALLRVVIDELEHDKYDQAKAHLHQFPLTTGNDTVLAGLGKAVFAQGDTTGAILVLERVAEVTDESSLLENLAVLYLMVGRQDDAAATFRRAIALAPDRTDLMAYLGGMLIQEGHPDQAIPLLEEVVRRDPESGAARERLADAKAALRKHQAN